MDERKVRSPSQPPPRGRGKRASRAKVKDTPPGLPQGGRSTARGQGAPPQGERGAAPEPGYTVGRWRGFTKWTCDVCGWDTLKGESEILTHIRAAHTPRPRPAPKTRKLPLYDRFGNQIEIVEEEEHGTD